jgi:hypothetical protein
MDKCDNCGARDGQQIGGSAVSLRPCVCFEYAFCGEACLQAHEQSRVVDEIHAEPSIDLRFRRIIRKGDYPTLLLEYTEAVIQMLETHFSGTAITNDQFVTLTETLPKRFAEEVNERERLAVRTALADYSSGILQNVRIMVISDKLLRTPSKTLIRVWESENRLAFQRSSVATAWDTYTTAMIKLLADVFLIYGLDSPPFESTEVRHDVQDLRRLSNAVGRVLNGGRWKKE